jgi:hypothetical protein
LILDLPITKRRSAIQTGLFAEQPYREKIDTLDDPLVEIEAASTLPPGRRKSTA